MKILIMVDMEGISGITSSDQVNADSGRFYAEGRQYVTWETNACIDGCFAGEGCKPAISSTSQAKLDAFVPTLDVPADKLYTTMVDVTDEAQVKAWIDRASYLIKNGSGDIVTITFNGSYTASHEVSAYCPSKHAVAGLAKGNALEQGPWHSLKLSLSRRCGRSLLILFPLFRYNFTPDRTLSSVFIVLSGVKFFPFYVKSVPSLAITFLYQ